MKHLASITTRCPAKAQFETVIQFVGLLSSLLVLLEEASRVFGFEIPQKNDDA